MWSRSFRKSGARAHNRLDYEGERKHRSGRVGSSTCEIGGGGVDGVLELKPRVCGGHVVEQLVAVLAHERLLVVTTDVVPRDAVTVHVVQHAQARLHGAVDVELGVVRLRRLLMAALAPRAVRPAGRRLVGGRYLATGGRPEPAVHGLRFQVRAVLASLEVAQPAAGPYVRRVVCEAK